MTRRFDALIVDFGGVLTTPLQDAMVHFADDLGIELQDLRPRRAEGVHAGSRRRSRPRLRDRTHQRRGLR